MTVNANYRKTWMGWAARLWSLPAILFVGAHIFSPEPLDAPVPWQDWALLAMIGLAVIGLIVSWRWVKIGGMIAVGGYLLHVALWPILRGGFAPTWWMLGLFVAGPGALFSYVDKLKD